LIAEDGITILRVAEPGESASGRRVIRSARPLRTGARLCRVPAGAVDRGDLSASPDLLAALIDAAGGLSLRAWLADALAAGDVDRFARQAAARGSSESAGARRTAVTIALTAERFAQFQAARLAHGVPVAAMVREAVRSALWPNIA
jgi:hypothetical protein